MSVWYLWILAALGFGALELKLSGYFMLWFSVGSVAAALTGALGLPVEGQLIVFTASSVALFLSSRTIFRRFFMRNVKRLKHGAEAMIGADAVVVDPLPEKGTGTVRINGELWSARSLEGAVTAGETVQVEGLDGLKLNVRRGRDSLTPSPRGEKR